MAPKFAVQAPVDVRINTPRLITSVLAWILAILLAIAFTLAGGIKLIGVPGMVQEFAQIGLGQWFRYFTGALELSGAIGLLIPKVRFWAALQIAVVMVGATFTNLTVLHLPVLARVTAILLALALVLAWLRRAEGHLPSVKFE
jgi:putative oxidoreductase